MAKLKCEPKSQIDTIREIDPHYAALLDRQAELTARHAEVLAEIQPLAEKGRRAQVSWVAQSPKPKPIPVVRHAGATALLGDLLPEQRPDEISPPPLAPSWPGEDRLRELGAESESISEALKLLTPELTKARRSYSKKVFASRKSDYAAVAESVVDAAVSLATAIQVHHEFITEMRLAGVAYREFRPLNLERFGNIDEPSSPLMRTVLDAVEMTHVGARKIPVLKMPADIALFAGGN